jgi:ribonuclease R
MSITKQAVLTALGSAYADGMRVSDLGATLGVDKRDHHRLRRLLSALVEEGVVRRLGRGLYTLSRAAGDDNRAVGRISVHPAGYGFVDREDDLEDVFIPAKYRGSSLDGDRVLVHTWDGYKGTEGRVEKVLSRGRARLTGTLRQAGRVIFLEPDDPRIATDYGHISLEAGTAGGKIGEAVVVEISRYPTPTRSELVARVTKVLGDPEDPRTEIEKIIACAEIPDEFPDEALAAAERTPREVQLTDLADRIDLRDRAFVTIDPEDARDFDDALCVEDGPHGPRVWVAVADVSHYVRPDTPLDAEARIRGVSVYLPDRMVPMLPLELASGVCSLNPGVDRLAMVVRLDFDDEGHVRDKGFSAAVIRSRARLDYPGVAAALAGDFRGRREVYRPWTRSLERLDALARTLRKRRMSRGALDIEIPEPKVILDDDDPRLVRDVIRAKGDEAVKGAYQLVEEFMIIANEAVGAYFEERRIDGVWRVHAPPEEDRVDDLCEVLAHYGVGIDPVEARTPWGMKDVLEAVADAPQARALSFLVLRSLKQAQYDTENIGHFGLASEEYLHFTSPIRRYPDVLVHRQLKRQLHAEGYASGGAAAMGTITREELQDLAWTSSQHERRAAEAEREAVSMYRAYLMRDHVGEERPGQIAAVTHFGAFVELDEPFVEGLIKLDGIADDSFAFDPLRMTLAGRRTGLTLELGDRVIVEVVGASLASRRVELRLVSVEGYAAVEGGRARRRRRERRRAQPEPRPARRGQGKGKGKGKGELPQKTRRTKRR